MKIKKQTLGIAQTNTYYIESKNGYIVVDPCLDMGYKAKRLLQPLGDKNVVAILITHGHFDHISGIDFLVSKFNCSVFMYYEEVNWAKNKFKNLSFQFGEPIEIISDITPIRCGKLNVDGLSFEVIKTPGHTASSISYIIGDNCFDGDFIFNNSVGRTDLPTGDEQVLLKNIRDFVNRYETANLYLYPGHGEITSLEAELKSNPYLKKNSRF